ncbi:MAG TPA: hypothetical protein VLL05_03495 [Terriglobales bacterium]|nr:hypothetical protein [Terriglobales bacterium]
MLRIALRALSSALLCVAAIAYAQDFSADVFNTTAKDAAKSGKVYVKGNKMRIDRGDASAEESAPMVLVDMDSNTVTIMDATNHVYMKTGIEPEQGLSFFRLKDANNACAELEKMSGMSGCKKAGNETVNARQTVKYAGKSKDGNPITVWADTEVSFIVKWQPKTGETGELRNIKVAPQADNSFTIPSGYHNAVKEADTETDTDKKDTKEEPPSTPQ